MSLITIASFLLFAVIASIVFSFIVVPYIKYRTYKKSKYVRGYFFPVLGTSRFLKNSFKRTGDFWGYYRELAKEQDDVQAHITNAGNRIALQLLDPKLIKEFFSQQHNYHKIPFAKTFQCLVGTGLLRAEGKVWKQHRKLLSNLFHYEFLRENLPTVIKTTREFLDELQKSPLDKVDIMDEIQKITGEIVGRIFFGENLNKYTMDGQLLTLYLADLLADIFRNQRSPHMVLLRMTGLNQNMSPVLRRLMEKVNEFRKMCFKIVNDRKASNIKANDMLGLMLETQNNPNKEEALSDEDIVNEFITFFTAGMDTTGHSITMSLYLLDKEPQYRKRLEEEFKNIYEREEYVSQDSLNQMEFTHAVIKETLRLYSPAPGTFPRVAIEDHKLLDFEVKKGMVVRPNFVYNCSNPKYFEDPDSFKPERWFNKSAAVDPYAYVPFSAGSRNCIGQHLSVTESKVILAEFLKRFDYEMPKDYQLKMTMGFLYEPAEKIRLRLIPKLGKEN